MRTNHFTLLMLFIGLFLVSCSNINDKRDPTYPASPDKQLGTVSWGSYSVDIDIEKQTAEMVRDRDLEYHLDVTAYLNPPGCGGPGCLQIIFDSWNPITFELTLDFYLENPTPYNVSDVRLIFPDFDHTFYPHSLIELDSFTDALTGLPRPFLAYKKEDPDRILYGHDFETITARIYWPPGSPFRLNFMISAWLWLNCGDPYEVTNLQQKGKLFQYSGTSTISCEVYDWQDDLTDVSLNSILLEGGSQKMSNPHGNLWSIDVDNVLNKPPGIYQAWVSAESSNPQNFTTYNLLLVEILEYGWHSTESYLQLGTNFSNDIGVYELDGAVNVNILRPESTSSPMVTKISGIENSAEDYVNLEDLDPNYPDYEPYPVDRIDAAKLGGFAWANWNLDDWNGTDNNEVFSLMKNNLDFIYEPLSDDNRFVVSSTYVIPDVCDTYEGKLCGLFALTVPNPLELHIVAGPPNGLYDYTDSDLVLLNDIAYGSDEGEISCSYASGMDVRESEISSQYYAYIAENNTPGGIMEIEVFLLDETRDEAEAIRTIYINYADTDLAPLDLELLPPNPGYSPAPDTNIMCVLVDRAQINDLPGGIVLIYNAETYDLIESIGNEIAPAVPFEPNYLDTDDESYSIVISHSDGDDQYLTQWTYYDAP